MHYEGHSLFLIFWVGCPFLVWFITIFRERVAFRLLCSPLLTPHTTDKYCHLKFQSQEESCLILSFPPLRHGAGDSNHYFLPSYSLVYDFPGF